MQGLIIYGGEMSDCYLVPQVLLPVSFEDHCFWMLNLLFQSFSTLGNIECLEPF